MTTVTQHLLNEESAHSLFASRYCNDFDDERQDFSIHNNVQILNVEENVNNLKGLGSNKNDTSTFQQTVQSERITNYTTATVEVTGNIEISLPAENNIDHQTPTDSCDTEAELQNCGIEECSSISDISVNMQQKADKNENNNSQTVLLDSSTHYKYTIDAEKMVSSLCNYSPSKGDTVASENGEEETGKEVSCSENEKKLLLSYTIYNPQDEKHTEKISSYCKEGLFTNASTNWSSPLSSDSGIPEDIPSPKSKVENRKVEILDNLDTCDDSNVTNSRMISSVHCQTDLDKCFSELHYPEKVIKLSEEICQAFSFMPPSATASAVAELCIGIRNCEKGNKAETISDGVMNNLVLSLLHVASSWMYLSSINGLKNIIHLFHPELKIIFKKWESSSISLLDYIINFISDSKKPIPTENNYWISNNINQHYTNRQFSAKYCPQDNHAVKNVYVDSVPNLHSYTLNNVCLEKSKLCDEEILLSSRFFSLHGDTVARGCSETLKYGNECTEPTKNNILTLINENEAETNHLINSVGLDITPHANKIGECKKIPYSLNSQRSDTENLISEHHLHQLNPNTDCLQKNANYEENILSNANKHFKDQPLNDPLSKIGYETNNVADTYLQLLSSQDDSNMKTSVHSQMKWASCNPIGQQDCVLSKEHKNQNQWINSINQPSILMNSHNVYHSYNRGSEDYLNSHYLQSGNVCTTLLGSQTNHLSRTRNNNFGSRYGGMRNFKSNGYKKKYGFKKQDNRYNDIDLLPIGVLEDSDSSDEAHQIVYMKPGSYSVPMKHINVTPLHSKISNMQPLKVSQNDDYYNNYILQQSNSAVNSDQMWKSACESVAQIMQIIHSQNDLNKQCTCRHSNDACERCQNSNKQESTDRITDTHGASSTTTAIQSNPDMEENKKLLSSSEDDPTLQKNNDINTLSEELFSNEILSKQTGSADNQCESSILMQTSPRIKESEERKEPDSNGIDIEQNMYQEHARGEKTIHHFKKYQESTDLKQDKFDNYGVRKPSHKSGGTRFNNTRAVWYRRHGLNREVASRLKSILNCIWNMDGSEFIKYPYLAGDRSTSAKTSGGIVLQTVAYKLRNHFYGSVEQFVQDFRKIFHNSKVNNVEDTMYTEMTSLIYKKFDSLLEEHFSGVNFKHGSGIPVQRSICTETDTNENIRSQINKIASKTTSGKKADATDVGEEVVE